MGHEKNFTRICPDCKAVLHCKRKKDAVYLTKKKILCRICANKKHGKPKEKYQCFTCNKEFLEWSSQLSNPATPFCSKQCAYTNRGDKASLVGKQFGKLQVIARERKDQTTFYHCKCNCGNDTLTTHSNLLSHKTESCGCLVKETRGSERKPIEEVMIRANWGTYKRNAKMRHYRWQLTWNQFKTLFNKPCYYCGAEGSNLFKHKYKNGELATISFNGIDRVDNELDYTIDNCVPCCRTCNSAKGSLTLDVFKAWANQLAQHLNQL